MSLNFFTSSHPKEDGNRYRAVNTVRVWLRGRNHLPKDLVQALHYLIPELKENAHQDGSCE